jgi:flagellar biosynthesis protein FliP
MFLQESPGNIAPIDVTFSKKLKETIVLTMISFTDSLMTMHCSFKKIICVKRIKIVIANAELKQIIIHAYIPPE